MMHVIKYSPRAKQRRHGFSLVEIMVGMTISLLTVSQAHHFFIFSTMGLHKSNLEFTASMDDRMFFNKLKRDALQASYTVMHDAFDGTFRDGILPPSTYRLDKEESGNFVLFVVMGVDDDVYDNIPAPIEKIMGYYLDDQDPHNQKIRRFEQTMSNTYLGDDIEFYLPDVGERMAHEVVFESVTGVLDGMIFYKYHNQALMLGAKVASGSNQWKFSRTLNSTIIIKG